MHSYAAAHAVVTTLARGHPGCILSTLLPPCHPSVLPAVCQPTIVPVLAAQCWQACGHQHRRAFWSTAMLLLLYCFHHCTCMFVPLYVPVSYLFILMAIDHCQFPCPFGIGFCLLQRINSTMALSWVPVVLTMRSCRPRSSLPGSRRFSDLRSVELDPRSVSHLPRSEYGLPRSIISRGR